MSRTAPKTALVIGATGAFGSHAVQAMLKHGWTIRALARDPVGAAAKAGLRTPIEWVKGDAMRQQDVMAAARGVQVIVHAANPKNYHNWRGLAVPMLRATIAAAEAQGARIVLPGNVYNFAPDAGASIAESAPQAPVTRKGKIRVEMETMLRAASENGARVLIVRAGDFLTNLSWLTTRSKGRVRALFAAGPASIRHAWVYLPDLAEITARLLDREAGLADFDVFHVTGHWISGAELAASVRRVVGAPKLAIWPFPWPLVVALSPFLELFRELLEMRYLQQKPIGLANAKLVSFLGAEPRAPLDVAVRGALDEIGVEACQPAPVGDRCPAAA